MARVVQQRSNPPYLLILFVFLFLLATALAVFKSVSEDKADKALAQKNAELRKIVSPQELQGATIQKRIKDFDNARQDKAATVVGQLSAENSQYVQLITGDVNSDSNTVVTRADQASKAFGSQPGLANMVLDIFANRLPQLDGRVKDRDDQIKGLKDELAAKAKSADDAAKSYVTDKEALDKRLAEIDAKLKANQEQRETAIKSVTDEKDKEIASLGQTIASLTAKVSTLEKENADLKKQVIDLQGLNPIGGGTEGNKVVVINPAGKISKVVDADGVVYIDLGSKDHITLGMTFAVYPATGIFADKKSDNHKGSIVVTAVSPDFSTCKITSKDKANPIGRDDLIANPVYDRTRVFRFVVEGSFDLANTGHYTAQGAEDVKAMIKRFGGEVQKEINANTDYVVVGDEPPQPPKADDSESAQAKANREAMLAELARFHDVVAKAQKMGIPVLNANRFLALVGYDSSLAGNH